MFTTNFIDFSIAISLVRELSCFSSDNQPSLNYSCSICVSTSGEAELFPADGDQKLARFNNALASRMYVAPIASAGNRMNAAINTAVSENPTMATAFLP